MVRWLAGMLVAAAAFAAPAGPALAAQAPVPRQEALVGTGTITITWQGDPALGCAAAGLCGAQGALIIDAQGPTQLFWLGRQGVIGLAGNGTTVARVITDNGGVLGECVDAPANLGGVEVTIEHRRHGGVAAALGPELSSGRCAGPLAQDFARVGLPVTERAGRHPSFDLRGTRSFAAGPFAVTLVSTLMLAPASGFGAGTSVSTGPSPPSRQRGFGGKPLVEHVTLRYRLTGLSSAFTMTFAGEDDPFCAVLDSCGATGTVTVSPAPGFSGTLTLTGFRPVSRPSTPRQVLADVRDGRISLGGLARGPLVTSETFVLPGGSTCRDSARTSGGVTVAGFASHRLLRVAVVEPSADVVRTHCPGPSQADVLGSENAFALLNGSIAPSKLLARHSVLTLTRPGSFSGPGYVGSRTGALQFALSLESIRVGVRAR